MDIQSIQRVHFIGIGGIGMSALARLFLHEGKKVSGSDRSVSPITCGLEALGVHLYATQSAKNITPDIELVVYTEAMQKDHEEMVAAQKLDIPMVNYFAALGLVANQYYLIAVSGTHGKTTTTAMLTDILEEASLDPTAIIGSLRSKTGSNFRPGKSKYAVVEACEYRRDFLSLTPDILVITNIEAEHLDYYKDLKDIQDAFRELSLQVREGGLVVANLSEANVTPVLENIKAKVVDYSKFVDPLLKLNQPGLHNQMNAAAATAAAAQVDIDMPIVKQALEHFTGTWRRFEYKGEMTSGAKVYDDYGHHPTEIAATLGGAKEMFPEKKILLVYQPHLGSRTEKLFGDFVRALSLADRVILAPIYAARAEDAEGASSKKLVKEIKKNGGNIEYFETFSEIAKRVKETATKNDLVLVMGAGDITDVAQMLI